MKSKILQILMGSFAILVYGAPGLFAQDKLITYQQQGLVLNWDVQKDLAILRQTSVDPPIWSGSLLPAFWLESGNKKEYVKCRVVAISKPSTQEWSLSLQVGKFGHGLLRISREAWGIEISELSVEWSHARPAIIEMYFGTQAIDLSKETVWPVWDRPFMPDWSAFGFCVPGAKGGTAQSYFRMWDFGQANIALGSFGPSMGMPYAAAFPRPLLYAGMGSDKGFLAIGTGSIPDAALSLNIKATRGCFQYLYREDLWGSPPGNHRVWKNILRLCIGERAWDAFSHYTRSFPGNPGNKNVRHAWAIWNTWGMWRQQRYAIPPIASFATALASEILVLDDPWEISQGAGRPDLQKFPDFYKDIEAIHRKGLAHGVWETVGWLSDPAAFGLGREDLLLGRNGKPCKANWNFDPGNKSFYCLDISSAKAREFLKARTIRIMHELHPKIIKLDFGYGLPDPNMAAARNPAYRGERQSFELFRLIRDAARSVDPEVSIMGYSLSPLWIPVLDIISLDDQGDLWYDIPQGHQEWSIWASLLSNQNISINGSSGYDWSLDEEVLLNTCILGAPGSVLPSVLDNGSAIPPQYLNRRLAVNTWYRRSLPWLPSWMNSQTGNFSSRPSIQNWGRLERYAGDTILSALVLRDSTHLSSENEKTNSLHWSGRWALVSQDNKDIHSSDSLAIIPFRAGKLYFPFHEKPRSVRSYGLDGIHPFDHWDWKEGILQLECTAESLAATAGYLVLK